MSTVELKTDVVFISVPEAANIIGCTGGRVRQLLIEGVLKGVKLNERAWAVRKDSAKKYAVPKTTGRPRKNS
jgi:hypothetical protein